MSELLVPNESDLINKVKLNADSDALITLVDQHTGIYFTVVQRYAKSYPDMISRDDMSDDRFYNIHEFIKDYNPARRTKLSTYIHDRTDYLCRSILRDERANPLHPIGRPFMFNGSGVGVVEPNGDAYMSNGGKLVILSDESSASSVVDVADKDLKLEEIMDTAACVCKDRRFMEILKLRHFGDGHNMQLSWRQIGTVMGISHETARKVYEKNIELVRQHLAMVV